PCVVIWSLLDVHRVTLIPPGHWLLLQDTCPFRARLDCDDGRPAQNVESVATREGHIACFGPRQTAADAVLRLARYAQKDPHIQAGLHFLAPVPGMRTSAPIVPHSDSLVLLTNDRGGMARLCVDLGRVLSKYDCVLGANLHPSLPVDRHVFAKRIRLWVNADGFISPLDFRSLVSFEAGPPAVWHLIAQAVRGRPLVILVTSP